MKIHESILTNSLQIKPLLLNICLKRGKSQKVNSIEAYKPRIEDLSYTPRWPPISAVTLRKRYIISSVIGNKLGGLSGRRPHLF